VSRDVNYDDNWREERGGLYDRQCIVCKDWFPPGHPSSVNEDHECGRCSGFMSSPEYLAAEEERIKESIRKTLRKMDRNPRVLAARSRAEKVVAEMKANRTGPFARLDVHKDQPREVTTDPVELRSRAEGDIEALEAYLKVWRVKGGAVYVASTERRLQQMKDELAKLAVLVFALLAFSACAPTKEHYHPLPEAHDFFGPDICARRTWPYSTVASRDCSRGCDEIVLEPVVWCETPDGKRIPEGESALIDGEWYYCARTDTWTVEPKL
jgi:hypothetical protein